MFYIVDVMHVYQWTLLAFAGWTFAIVVLGVGTARWSRILSGRARLTDFPTGEPHGSPRYRRIMRAHANCIETLPVYAAIVICAFLKGGTPAWFDTLAVVLMLARVAQSVVHIAFNETTSTVALRFSFFTAQAAVMVSMGIALAS